MNDVLIVGAGPAGSIAGLVLARAGARVRIVDRATFPRDKLCGDTVNPGTLARLRALGVADAIDARGWRVAGMILTSEREAIVGRYPAGLCGRAILRRDLDAMLLDCAIAAGCEFEPRVTVTGAALADGRVVGVRVAGARGHVAARVTIAADGRRSSIAWQLGAARHPVSPRRWAVGSYWTQVRPFSLTKQSDRFVTFGEMHVRRNCYIGVAPVGPELTNVCLVRPSTPRDPAMRDPQSLLTSTIAGDPHLRARLADGELIAPPVILGPLAVDVTPPALDGLLLAGDAAGFIDPMTGDGLRFAVRGGELAADAALEALTHGWQHVHKRLAARRRDEFGSKQRFNRGLRTLVASPALVDAAAIGARVAPFVFQRVIAHAGDCDVARLKARAPEREASAERW
jgi:flavin-dependent dehydrogenase